MFNTKSYIFLIRTRWLDRRIYKTELKFWADLGRRGCREKKLPTAISMQLFVVVFSTFCASALKSYIKKKKKLYLEFFL